MPRIGYSARGADSRFPMDAALNLPNDPFSMGIRYTVALVAASSSFEQSAVTIAATTQTQIAKRQIESLSRAAAVDFDNFYTERAAPQVTESSSLLVLSCDGKGVVVRLEDLRPATRKAATARKPRLKTRLSRGEKKHAKRMAMVTTVYTVAPHLRTADDIIADLTHQCPPDKRKRPHAEDKRTWATLQKEPVEAIRELFDEAERRDPEHRRKWAVLVDGNKDQLALIKAEAARRGVRVTIIVDFIHVLGYLWGASTAFHRETDVDREQWVLSRLHQILLGKATDVAAGMRRSATMRELPDSARKAVDDCADYLLNYKAYLHYDIYLREGMPIASGVIEGACRHLVNDRLGITGAHWSLQGAEAILKLRALRVSGDFEQYWTFHEAREFGRNHQDKYTGRVPLPAQPRRPTKLRLIK